MIDEVNTIFQTCFVRQRSFHRLVDSMFEKRRQSIKHDLGELRGSTNMVIGDAERVIHGAGPHSLGTLELAVQEERRRAGLPYCEFGGFHRIFASSAFRDVQHCRLRDNRFGEAFGEQLASKGILDLSTVLRELCGVLLQTLEHLWEEDLRFVYPQPHLPEGLDLVVVLRLRDVREVQFPDLTSVMTGHPARTQLPDFLDLAYRARTRIPGEISNDRPSRRVG